METIIIYHNLLNHPKKIKKSVIDSFILMSDKQLLEKIIIDPKIMVGKPIIKGTRLTVEYILNLLAHDESEENILVEHNGITIDDIKVCLLFATKSLKKTSFMPLETELV